MEDKKLLLDIQDLSIHYVVESGTVHAVEHLNLTLAPGENLGFVGETGAGKTTTALGIMGLVPNPPGKVVSGKILFEGEDLLKKPEEQMRSIRGGKIAMIFQDPMTSLNPVITVDKQIAEMVLLHNDVTEQQALERAEEMLELVGIKRERAKDYPHQFSGGQRQRIVLARALAVGPKFVVCDEPVSALDVSTQSQIINLLEKLQHDMKLTYLFIAHNLSVVRHISDRIGVMYLGHLMEEAETDSLFERPMHPYTQALLSAVPHPNPRRKRERVILSGDVPSPLNLPTGCVFHTRCPYAIGACRDTVPDLREVDARHKVACHKVHDWNI